MSGVKMATIYLPFDDIYTFVFASELFQKETALNRLNARGEFYKVFAETIENEYGMDINDVFASIFKQACLVLDEDFALIVLHLRGKVSAYSEKTNSGTSLLGLCEQVMSLPDGSKLPSDARKRPGDFVNVCGGNYARIVLRAVYECIDISDVIDKRQPPLAPETFDKILEMVVNWLVIFLNSEAASSDVVDLGRSYFDCTVRWIAQFSKSEPRIAHLINVLIKLDDSKRHAYSLYSPYKITFRAGRASLLAINKGPAAASRISIRTLLYQLMFYENNAKETSLLLDGLRFHPTDGVADELRHIVARGITAVQASSLGDYDEFMTFCQRLAVVIGGQGTRTYSTYVRLRRHFNDHGYGIDSGGLKIFSESQLAPFFPLINDTSRHVSHALHHRPELLATWILFLCHLLLGSRFEATSREGQETEACIVRSLYPCAASLEESLRENVELVGDGPHFGMRYKHGSSFFFHELFMHGSGPFRFETYRQDIESLRLRFLNVKACGNDDAMTINRTPYRRQCESNDRCSLTTYMLQDLLRPAINRGAVVERAITDGLQVWVLETLLLAWYIDRKRSKPSSLGMMEVHLLQVLLKSCGFILREGDVIVL